MGFALPPASSWQVTNNLDPQWIYSLKNTPINYCQNNQTETRSWA